MTKHTRSYADHTGIMASTLCLIHCLAAPVFVFIGAGFFTNPFFSYAFVLISFLAIWKATQSKERKKLNTFLWIAFAVFAISILFEEKYQWLHYTGYISSGAIVIGHSMRLRLIKKKRRENVTTELAIN